MSKPSDLSIQVPSDLWYVPVKALGKGKGGPFNLQHSARIAAVEIIGSQLEPGGLLATTEIRAVSQKILRKSQAKNEMLSKSMVEKKADDLLGRWGGDVRKTISGGAGVLGEHPEWWSAWIEAGLRVMAGDSHMEPYLQGLDNEQRVAEIRVVATSGFYFQPGRGLHIIELALMSGPDALGEVIDRLWADTQEKGSEDWTKVNFWKTLAHNSLRPWLVRALTKRRVAQMMASSNKEVRLLGGQVATEVIKKEEALNKKAGRRSRHG